jgi:hypothetical protein
MTSFTLDTLGQWVDLGAVTPVYGTWQPFPLNAEHGFNTFRLSFTGEWFNGWHWAVIREQYFLNSDTYLKGITRRLYPDTNPKIIYFSVSEEFQLLNPVRSFEIIKQHKYIKTYGGRFNDKVFSVKLEEFVAYPDLIAQITQQELKESTIDRIAERVLDLISNLLPPNN